MSTLPTTLTDDEAMMALDEVLGPPDGPPIPVTGETSLPPRALPPGPADGRTDRQAYEELLAVLNGPDGRDAITALSLDEFDQAFPATH